MSINEDDDADHHFGERVRRRTAAAAGLGGVGRLGANGGTQDTDAHEVLEDGPDGRQS
jgi:hypothetical protein